MAISKDLFLALLSMDAYNEGYGAGLQVASSSGGTLSVLGNAVIQDIALPAGSEAAGFYAVAYKTTKDIGTNDTGGIISAGTTIISSQPSPRARGEGRGCVMATRRNSPSPRVRGEGERGPSPGTRRPPQKRKVSPPRHDRARPGHPRRADARGMGVDARVKPAHDDAGACCAGSTPAAPPPPIPQPT